MAMAMFDRAKAGDVPEAKEIGDRLDGKPHQSSDDNVDLKANVTINSYVPDPGN